MTQSHLHGLNVIHPTAQGHSYTSDSQDLLTAPPFPDLAAQLDLWTNLTFRPDEPLVNRREEDHDKNEQYMNDEGDEDGEDEGTATIDGHTNVVNPQVVQSNAAPPRVDHHSKTFSGDNQQSFNIQQSQEQHQFDLNAVLAGFGIDPYLVPQVQNPAILAPLHQSPAISLAQLLATYPLSTGNVTSNSNIGISQSGFWNQTPAATLNQLSQLQMAHPQAADVGSPSDSPPTAKKSRTRKASMSSATVAATSSIASSPVLIASNVKIPPSFDSSSNPPLSPDITTPMTASEDKRRRNTAASARFRLKKKEREAALESKSKELEARVGELERECENLRRENGWLKGLVVGVANKGNRNSPSPDGEGGGNKRKREGDRTEKDSKVSGNDAKLDA